MQFKNLKSLYGGKKVKLLSLELGKLVFTA